MFFGRQAWVESRGFSTNTELFKQLQITGMPSKKTVEGGYPGVPDSGPGETAGYSCSDVSAYVSNSGIEAFQGTFRKRMPRYQPESYLGLLMRLT